MSERIDAVRLGTRGSMLARWQTDYVAGLLAKAWPHLHIHVEVLHTQGDRVLDRPLPVIGGKGLFTAELEEALHSGAIDLAVHSLKDLPIELASGLTIGAIPTRGAVHDVVISRSGHPLAQLPAGATVGTSSRRRGAQLLRTYPHLRPIDIRGNVDTRIRKTLDPAGPYDAIMLAAAGIERHRGPLAGDHVAGARAGCAGRAMSGRCGHLAPACSFRRPRHARRRNRRTRLFAPCRGRLRGSRRCLCADHSGAAAPARARALARWPPLH
jgi:hypothetical protein